MTDHGPIGNFRGHDSPLLRSHHPNVVAQRRADPEDKLLERHEWCDKHHRQLVHIRSGPHREQDYVQVPGHLPVLRVAHGRLLHHRVLPHARLANGGQVHLGEGEGHRHRAAQGEPDGSRVEDLAMGPRLGDCL